MKDDAGTAHAVVQSDAQTKSKMTVGEWVGVAVVIGFLGAFLGRGIFF